MRYHVGKYIRNYMEVLDINASQLSLISGVSKMQIKNIIDEKSGISIEIAQKIAKPLSVTPGLLLNLHSLYIAWIKEEKFKAEHHKIYKLLTDQALENIDNSILTNDNLSIFKNNNRKMTLITGVNYYQPSSSNIVKEFAFIQILNSIDRSDEEFDLTHLQEYIANTYKREISKILDENIYHKAMKKIITSLSKFGVSVKLIRTGLRTTTKGASKFSNNRAFVLVEETNDISNNIWYLTHELMHVINSKVDKEDVINDLTGKTLLGFINDNLIEISHNDIETNREELIKNEINPFIAHAAKQYKTKYRGIPLSKVDSRFVLLLKGNE